jgi:E3 ubiquitin-protein ligase DOA10
MPAEISAAFPPLMPNLRGLLVTVLAGIASPQLVTGLVVVASVGILCVAAFQFKGSVESQFSAALIAAMLTSYHLYSHDAVLLLLPVVLGLSTLRTRPAKIISGLATALWFVSPAIFMLMKYNLVSLLAILIAGIAFALWLDARGTVLHSDIA